MKNIKRSLLVPSLAIALPCLAFAQSGTSTPSSTTQRDTSGAQSTQRGTTGSPSASQRDATGASSGYSSSQHAGSKTSSATGMQRVSESQLENQLTAKALIGADVHGSDGEKVGSVVDVVLAPSRMAGSAGSYGSQSSSSSGYQDAGVTGSATRSATAGAPDSSASQSARSGMAGAMQNMQNMQNMQPAVIVSTGGLMGIGNDLVRVPISRISYDHDEEEIRLNVTEEEWEALRNSRASGGVTSTNR